MTASTRNHVAFWKAIADCLSKGQTLKTALETACRRTKGTKLAAAAGAVLKEVTANQPLSKAMEKQAGAFTKTMAAVVRIGEIVGRPGKYAQIILEGVRDGAFCLPGAAPAKSNEQVRYWRAMGRLLGCGVPILQVIDLLEEHIRDVRLRQANQAVRRSILEGKLMIQAVDKFPDVFAPEIQRAIADAESGGTLDAAAMKIADALESGNLSALAPKAAAGQASAPTRRPQDKSQADARGDQGAVVTAVNEMLVQAVARRASDIHVETRSGGRGQIRIRIDGVLQEIPLPRGVSADAIIGRIKIMSALEAAQKRTIQDGRIMTKIDGCEVDLRVAAAPTVYGERVTMRILVRQSISLDLTSMGFSDDEIRQVQAVCRLPQGLVLVTGPAGCGKTTLLYAMLQQIDRKHTNVITIEDPVEYVFDDISQIPISAQTGVTFPRAIRSVLRQDPDVIMAGEIRDLETAELLVQCALTGHLVMSTLHTNTAPGALQRLVDMGLEPFLISSTVQAAISQRLIRVLCPDCKKKALPPRHSIPSQAVEIIQSRPDAAFHEPVGCPKCAGTGYRGRTAIHGIMIMNERLRQAVADKIGPAEVRAIAVESGMKTMLADGLEKAATGVTSVHEVCRVAPLGD